MLMKASQEQTLWEELSDYRESYSLYSLVQGNASDSMVLQHIPLELRDTCAVQKINEADVYTKTPGIEWNAHGDYFRLIVGAMPHFDVLTKRKLMSDIAKTFDVLGWFSPSIEDPATTNVGEEGRLR